MSPSTPLQKINYPVSSTFLRRQPLDPFSMQCHASTWAHPGSVCAVRPSRRPQDYDPHSSEILAFRKTSYKSQYGEDAEIFNQVFWNVRNGIFLEIGALDGERYSNTWLFEKELNWRGILIEGSPKNYKLLVRKRPNAIRVNPAVCDQYRLLHYVENDKDGGNQKVTAVGGFWEFFDNSFKKRFHSHLTDGIVAKYPTVRCTRMEDILDRFGITHVDFWSLDVENAEEIVLKSVNWDRFSASIILMEVKTSRNSPTTKSNGASDFLLSKGYRMFKTLAQGRNAIFAHPKFYEQLVKLHETHKS